MALVGALSTQVWHEQLVASRPGRYPVERAEPRASLDLRPLPLTP
jgi:hypothetical protein